ncbi:class I SAM-dependent methyltransferase [Streptomyces sp. SCL15-6]|uniref:class I SAM-dependent methyltransferase n=1 Tax=Streptomyces sp. SCL15-6 TaxID=2967222 RepID=UPI0029662C2B|nr:class I SAM-dependent methyltransferase [Streptomyces sp. SCL15-6]
MTVPTADLWHHFGRARRAADRTVPGTFRWNWGPDGGPGSEVLGDITGLCVGDFGAGSARHAAHLAVHHQPACIVAVDVSPAQHALAEDLYGHLAPRLRLLRCDVPRHLHAMAGAYGVLYSVFGAIDFTAPRELLPAASAALRPGGRLVFSTLGHHLGGKPAHPDVRTP